ncbi:MAG: hypothetical protein H6621_06385 [Halobacteriovoraceae bacterium]|nr:hypothetical protein [Halobacteriovoraceae bacterium]
MKKNQLIKLLVLGFSILTFNMSFAQEGSPEQAEVNIQNGKPHGDLTGVLRAYYTDGKVTKIEMEMDQEVMGSKSFDSTEAWSYDSETQSALVYKLKGPTHKWYFVYLGEKESSGSSAGNLYKVRETMDDIVYELKSGFNPKKIPSTWKKVGNFKF